LAGKYIYNGKGVLMLNQAPHHEDILCLIKLHDMRTCGGVDILHLDSRWKCVGSGSRLCHFTNYVLHKELGWT